MRISTSASRAAIAFVAFMVAKSLAAQDVKASQVLADARRAIGGKRIETLSSLSVQAALQRNVGNFQMAADLELLLGLPDKYVRSETSNNPMMSLANTTGFNGDRPVRTRAQSVAPGGGVIIRMGGPGPLPGPEEKPTPEQQEQLDKQVVRSAKQEISRLMLGWFATVHPSMPAQYSYAGEAQSPDGKAFIIETKTADGFAARLFIDEATHLPLMVTYQGLQPRVVTVGGPGPGAADRPPAQSATRPSSQERERVEADARRQIEQQQMQPQPTVEYTLFFDDWRDVDGIKFPHSLRRASAGTTLEEWTISKVKVNPKIDPKKFDSEQ
jgi:hypothetical protein